MKYKVSTVEKKNVIEKNYFEKDGKTFYIEQGYRWGYFVTEDKVDLENYDPEEGLMIYDYDVIDHSFDDGCWIEFYYDDEMTEEDREAIETAWEEDWYGGLESIGWSEDESEIRFLGELTVEEVPEEEEDEDGIEDHERE